MANPNSQLIQITRADYQKISKDFRGMWEGKRSCFAGCIMPGGGTRLVVEGVDFEIVADVRTRAKRSVAS